jgi:MFS family permease
LSIASYTFHQRRFGFALAIGSVGFVLGALLADPTMRRLGVGRVLMVSNGIYAVGYMLLPLALFVTPATVFIIWRALYGLSEPMYSVNASSLRQTITPDYLQSRVISTMTTVGHGALGVGSLLSGVLGTAIGVVPTLIFGGIICLLGTLPTVSTSIRKMHTMPYNEEHNESFRNCRECREL